MKGKVLRIFQEVLSGGNNYSPLLDVKNCFSWIVGLEWTSSLTGTINVERILNEDLNETLISFPIEEPNRG